MQDRHWKMLGCVTVYEFNPKVNEMISIRSAGRRAYLLRCDAWWCWGSIEATRSLADIRERRGVFHEQRSLLDGF